jgi:hypothetical protein
VPRAANRDVREHSGSLAHEEPDAALRNAIGAGAESHPIVDVSDDATAIDEDPEPVRPVASSR